MENLKKKFNRYGSIIKYLSYSIFVTVIDIAAVWVIMSFLNVGIVYANTIGIIIGFIIHYLLASKSVFNVEYGILGIGVYFITFLFGLLMADFIVYLSYIRVFYFLGKDINFLLSKGASIVIPFFVMYFMRKYIYLFLGKYFGEKGGMRN
ncbi:putative flippase GtrA [Clostridium acetobutylicum]|uniref:Predicted membrane protein n=1 Tax=Clostridium acetobutylicum (strain ATCC 824 / DSM 792 / JCM 1419 / IAM 19013 / LMG 5710 / NBRC 13948 / NRRL B-527 / VKM B-1787 / 2291 / W) TaxID=272562 RepID=Q97FY8_CLOAB|nr:MULTISPECIES: GtrA family protein [Clostridium]AAK80535.1 Predicted membrane protein [Clostridium acetobutylicum ATCC 824]ADZ21634.1 membrane protein [Clostridium acetobutylicum EA 2018]AEI32449.1 hypothetical protein SMB_G2621 [Clostridium acetobutylicum DSM 1731]AWV79047.1 hypothetical protein DK921_02825 [Clostridium acetobutylicum]MBC2394992.1 hypothetical protein [Clostridium acetobutylicum]